MPIHAPPETLTALGGDLLPRCESRSLFKDRFADPLAKDSGESTPRKNWFEALVGSNRKAESHVDNGWLPASAERLYARLMSRLLVDLAGGVMENANVSLDRYGLPIVPGSAVKGCARRMALQALHDWAANQEAKNSEAPPATDDACAPCCEGFKKPSEMLAAIARVFGWTPEDWKAGKKDDHYKSDFAWAVSGNVEIIEAAKASLPAFENFAGTIAFLAASPNRDPGLELDVVTPHHTIYHSPEPDRNRDRQKWETWQAHRAAPDTEDPVPVFFPTVKPQGEGEYFTFPLIPLRLANDGNLTHAKRWLAHGLQVFGIGAKTNAGYGWFDASRELNERITQRKALEARVSELVLMHTDFPTWSVDRKEEAILLLSDQKEDCRAWAELAPDSFAPVAQYADSIDIPLL